MPQAIGDFLVLRAVRERRVAIAVTDEAITAAIDEVARAGNVLCPEGAADLRGAPARSRRPHSPRNPPTGLKYPMPPVGRRLHRLQPIDFATL